MRLVAGLAAVLVLGRSAGAPLSFCVLPPTRHLNFSEPCESHAAISAPNVSWAAMRGEYESVQILLDAPLPAGDLRLTFSDLVAPSGGATIPSAALSWSQQGYIFVRHTSRYADSGCPGKNKDGSCWRPDPLLPPRKDGTIELLGEPGESQPLWITVAVPRNAAPAPEGAEYTGTVTMRVTGGGGKHGGGGGDPIFVPISLEVWPVTVPTTAEATIQNVWGFSAAHVLPFYPHLSAAEVTYKWWDFMTAHRIPPLEAAFETVNATAAHPSGSAAYLQGKTGVLESGLERKDCNCSSCPPEAAKANALAMASKVAAAKATGGKYYAYAFDEAPKSCEKSIRAAFGAFLEAYPPSSHPEVGGTMSALNWAAATGGNSGPTGSHPSARGMPMDMPYTAWVLQYQYYNQTIADWWVNSTEPVTGRPRELYLYHCIEPSKPEYLNIFIERPLIHARLLFWLGASQNIQGWLYWTTDLWQNCPTSPEKYSWQHANRTVMQRINGSKYTDCAQTATPHHNLLPMKISDRLCVLSRPGVDHLVQPKAL